MKCVDRDEHSLQVISLPHTTRTKRVDWLLAELLCDLLARVLCAFGEILLLVLASLLGGKSPGSPAEALPVSAGEATVLDSHSGESRTITSLVVVDPHSGGSRTTNSLDWERTAPA